MSRRAGADVVVVGAGVIGASIAWRLGQRGLSVALLDPEPGRGASYAAAGMLAPVSEASYGEENLLRLCLESVRRYPGFLADLCAATGRRVELAATSTLVVAGDPDDLRVLDDLADYHRQLGLPVRRLTARQCRAEEPLLSPRVSGGLGIDVDGAVDPRDLVPALLAAARSAGARLLRHRVAEILVAGGAVAGVRLHDDQELLARRVVIAAGSRSGRSGPLGSLPAELVPPVHPVKGQVLRLRGDDGPRRLTKVVRGWVHGSPIYAVPYRDGRVAVGATVEDRGFDTTVTAGSVYELLRDAMELLPGLAEMELAEATARSRPGTPDNAPLIGATALPGLLLATGHYRNGVLLAPITAEIVADTVAGTPHGPVAAQFSPLRFSPTFQEVGA